MPDQPLLLARGALGLAVFVGVGWLLSENRRAINWRLILTALALQFVIAAAVLHLPPVRAAVGAAGGFFVRLLAFTGAGTKFVFGSLTDPARHDTVVALGILPSIIFFAAFSGLLYYLGILQRIVLAFAWLLARTMRLSGAESLSAAGNIFLGQTEAPLLIKPYLAGMNRSELFCVMVGGMATIAGGVMLAYLGFLGGADEARQTYFATHFLTASVISAPAAILMAKLMVPQTEAVDRRLDVARDQVGANALDAICLGTTDGIRLAVNVAGMVIVFVALVALVNFVLGHWLGDPLGLNALVARLTGGVYDRFSLEFLLGLLGVPVAWLLGISDGHLLVSGQLLGIRTVLTEFISYLQLGQMQAAGTYAQPRDVIIMTYALCGFGNLMAIGIQVGGIGALAPGQRANLSLLGFRALIAANLACFLTAGVAGLLTP